MTSLVDSVPVVVRGGGAVRNWLGYLMVLPRSTVFTLVRLERASLPCLTVTLVSYLL